MIMWCFTTSIIVASVVVCLSHFGGLWGNLKTASEAFKAKFYLRFDASNLNYPGIYLHIAWNSHYGGLWGHSGLQMTSEVTSDLKFELSGLNNPCSRRVMNKDRCSFMNDSKAQKAEQLSFLFTRKSFNFGAILSPKICTILQIIPKRKPILMYKKRIIQLFEP